MDGHTGLQNDKLSEHTSKYFHLVLGGLDVESELRSFIVHAVPLRTAPNRNTRQLSPGEFLARIGFKFCEQCTLHYRKPCHWIALVNGNKFDSTLHVDAHKTFQAHAEKIDDTFDLYSKLHIELTRAGVKDFDLFPELRQREAPIVEPPKHSLPTWVEVELQPSFSDVAARAKTAVREYERMIDLGRLLFETGETLTRSVSRCFKDCGFSVCETERGHTYDLHVVIDDSRSLLVEVTGIDGPLKKNSDKVGQVLAAWQEADSGGRVLLAVNTSRNTPVRERRPSDVITPDALSVFEAAKVVIVETCVLFDIWKQSLSDRDAARERVLAIHGAPAGIFKDDADAARRLLNQESGV